MKLRDRFSVIFEKILSFSDKILEMIPEEKKRIYIFVPGALIFFAICLIIISLATGKSAPSNQVAVSGPVIPAEELFYPAEPDFLPALLLEEPIREWTMETVLPFWQDPGLNHEEQWREAARAVIDKLMEGVP